MTCLLHREAAHLLLSAEGMQDVNGAVTSKGSGVELGTRLGVVRLHVLQNRLANVLKLLTANDLLGGGGFGDVEFVLRVFRQLGTSNVEAQVLQRLNLQAARSSMGAIPFCTVPVCSGHVLRP